MGKLVYSHVSDGASIKAAYVSATNSYNLQHEARRGSDCDCGPETETPYCMPINTPVAAAWKAIGRRMVFRGAVLRLFGNGDEDVIN